MAIIGKIRNNSVLVVCVVAGALILFVLSDFLGNSGGGSNPETEAAGEVFGEEINLMDFEREVQGQVDIARENARRQGSEFTDDDADRIREAVWNARVNRIIFEKELSGFNFTTTPAELNDLIFGNNIQPDVMQNQMFFNKFTKQFSLDSVRVWRQRADRIPEVKEWWVNSIELPIKDNRRIAKYFNLIQKGMYVTNAEVVRNYNDNNRRFKVRYITSQFDKIADSLINVSDADLRAYYNEHKHRKKFEMQGSRVFSWVEFELRPSESDIAEAKGTIDRFYEEFKKSTNDSAFVMDFAETKMFNDQYSQPGQLSPAVDSLVQKADSGQFVGPVLDGDYWKVIKIRGVKMEQEARVRHILLSKEKGSTAELKKRADSIINVIKKNNNFDEMVTKFTDDPGSKNNGGVYEWFGKGRMVKEFEKASFEGKLNSLTAVETEYGIHIVEPLGRRDVKRVKTAMVDVKVLPLKQTDMAVRGQAVAFLEKVSDATKFQEVAQSMRLKVLTKEIAWNQKAIDEDASMVMYGMPKTPGTQGGRTVAAWVHRANENDVSEPTIFNDRYVVIKLDNIKPKGVPEFEDVKEIMKLEVLRIKKGEIEAKKMKGARTLEELATRLKVEIQTAELTFGSTSFPGTGSEYAVIGSVFSMKKVGDMSVPLKGKNGVYVVSIEAITEAPAMAPEQAAKLKTDLTGTIRSRAQGDAYTAIRELAKIEDKRSVY